MSDLDFNISESDMSSLRGLDEGKSLFGWYTD